MLALARLSRIRWVARVGRIALPLPGPPEWRGGERLVTIPKRTRGRAQNRDESRHEGWRHLGDAKRCDARS